MTDADAGAQRFLARRAAPLTAVFRRLVEQVAGIPGKTDAIGSCVPPALAQGIASGPGRARREIAVVIPSPLGTPVHGNAPSVGQLLVDRRATGPDAVTLAVMQQGEGDARPLGEILVEHGATTAAQVVDALRAQAEAKRSADSEASRAQRDLLDSLPRLLAEVVAVRDGIHSRLEDLGDPLLHRSLQRLDAVAAELQDKLRGSAPSGSSADAGSCG